MAQSACAAGARVLRFTGPRAEFGEVAPPMPTIPAEPAMSAKDIDRTRSRCAKRGLSRTLAKVPRPHERDAPYNLMA